MHIDVHLKINPVYLGFIDPIYILEPCIRKHIYQWYHILKRKNITENYNNLFATELNCMNSISFTVAELIRKNEHAPGHVLGKLFQTYSPMSAKMNIVFVL